jgi:anti-sigma B factor antagonist
MELSGSPRAWIDVAGASGGELVVALGGELDLASLPAVGATVDELLTRLPQPMVLDLAHLTFLDSSGVTLLVRLVNHFGQVRTRSATEPVRRVIEVLGLADRFGLDGA